MVIGGEQEYSRVDIYFTTISKIKIYDVFR